jgi:Zn-dependent metalloprotease
MRDSLLKSLILWTFSFIAFVLVSTTFLKVSISIRDVNEQSSTQQVAGVNTDPIILNDPQKNTELKNRVGSSTLIGVDNNTKALSFLSISPSRGGIRALSNSQVTPEDAGINFNREYSTYMGVSNPDENLSMQKKSTDELGMTRIIYKQMYGGVPVFGAQTAVHLNGNNEVIAYEGNTVPDIQLDTVPTENQNNALEIAIAEHQRLKGIVIDRSKLQSSVELEILNKNLFILSGDTTTYLTWKVSLKNNPTLNDVYFVNAHSSEVVYHYSNIISAINRTIYDCSYGDTLCYLDTTLGSPSYTYGRSEGQPARGVTNQNNNPKNYPDTDTTYDYLGYAHNYYVSIIGRNGANNLGGLGDGSLNFPSSGSAAFTFIDVVDDLVDPICPNAFWNGSYIGICIGLSKLDTIAHEYQHAVTQYSVSGVGFTNGGESGTLSESFSDIFAILAEFNQLGYNDVNNPSSLEWLVMEGVDPADTYGFNITRSLNNPSDFDYGTNLPYPDRFYSESFYCGTDDDGGVHYNATVFSHSAYLMAMGGSFNGCDITGIGRAKMQLILYRTLTVHSLPSTDFNGMYNAVNQSCTELIGQWGISLEDCNEVMNAMKAVEIDQDGICIGTPRVAPQCSGLGGPTPTPTETPTPTPTPIISISSTVQLEYSTDNSGEIEVAYVATVGDPVEKSSSSTAINGDFNMGISLLSAGDYSFYFKPQYYLSRVTRQTISLGNNSITMDSVFEPGDFNNDDTINSVDYSLFVNNYNATGLGDINDDGVVNSIDFSILYNNYGNGGDYLTDYPSGWTW